MPIERSSDADVSRRGEMARALTEGGFDDVHVVDREMAATLLTEKRQELIERIGDSDDVTSVRSLAADLDRDVAAVSRDLDVLFEADVVEYDTDGRRKIPRLKHGSVVAEPIA